MPDMRSQRMVGASSPAPLGGSPATPRVWGQRLQHFDPYMSRETHMQQLEDQDDSNDNDIYAIQDVASMPVCLPVGL